MTGPDELVLQATAVAIGGRALVIEGPPGAGKSTLALALIDRGAKLIGDDGVTLTAKNGRLVASPPPNIAGKLEIRGVGIVELPVVNAPVALLLSLAQDSERLPEKPSRRVILGCDIPELPFLAGCGESALRAEWALRIHGHRETGRG